MKTLLVRVSVLALAVIGFTAASASTTNKNVAVKKTPTMIPMCMPNSGQVCGMQ